MKSREQFEKWAESKWFTTTKSGDEYIYTETKAAWEAWQASRAWMPIESAPKTGETILAKCYEDYIQPVFYVETIEYTDGERNIWKSRITNNYVIPIAWQYLPE